MGGERGGLYGGSRQVVRRASGRAGERAGKGWEGLGMGKRGRASGRGRGGGELRRRAAVACNRPLLGKWTGSMDQLEKERELKRPLSMAELLYETPHGLATV